MKQLRLVRLDYAKLIAGGVLILLGVLAPLLFNIQNFHITQTLRRGLYNWDRADIMLAALSLVLLNTVRALPHYLGAFFIADSFQAEFRGKKQGWINVAVVVGLIVAVYQIIGLVHNIHYDFGAPAMLLVTLQVLLWKVNYSYVSIIKKVPMMASFILAFQFLDVIPALTDLPFGRGETSHDIKMIASIVGCTDLLNGMAGALFLAMLLIGVLFFLILRDENHLWQISELKEQNEHIRMEALMRERDNRATRELQHLVHDLKSPLTAIQALAGALQYKCSAPEQTMEREYLARIEASVEHMSNMISEILYEDRRYLFTTYDLLGIVLAQISPTEYAGAVSVDNRTPDTKVRVNSLRFARAVINLVENAYHARREEEPIRIHLQAELIRRTPEEEAVCITITDNARGIPREELDRVWERGFSKRGSSGLGMSFVRDVVEQSEGEITIESQYNQGTRVTIILPKGETER